MESAAITQQTLLAGTSKPFCAMMVNIFCLLLLLLFTHSIALVVSTGLRYTTYPLPEEKKKVAVEEPPVTPAPGAQKPSSAKAKDTEGGGAQKAAEPSGPEKVELLFK